jgi:hypothetical protein
VDPALVMQQFGSKRALYAQATAMPEGTGSVLAAAFAGDPGRMGERVAGMLAAWLADPVTRAALTGRVRAAAADPGAAEELRAHLVAELEPFALAVAGDDRPALRTGLLAAELLGAVTAREIAGDEALAALAPRELVAVLAPAFQRCLTGALAPAP